MKLIFAGTPDFAAMTLGAILEKGHEVSLVLTQPDRPAGRGMAPRPSAVKNRACQAGIEVIQPLTLRENAIQEKLRAQAADVLIVAAYGLILPAQVIGLFKYGAINIHASLLPRWRGAAPIQRAILAGDHETGVCIMQMEAGLDTGPVLQTRRLTLSDKESAGTLHDKLAVLGAEMIVDVMDRLPLEGTPQSTEGITYAAKIEKKEAWLDWNSPAETLERQVRAFDPAPGAQTGMDGKTIKIWKAEIARMKGDTPGHVLKADKDGIVVACGHGALQLCELQKAGGRRMTAAEFLSGSALKVGMTFNRMP